MRHLTVAKCVQCVKWCCASVLITFSLWVSAQVDQKPAASSGGLSVDVGSIFNLIARNVRSPVRPPMTDEMHEMGQVQVLWDAPEQAAAGEKDILQSHQMAPIAVEHLSNLGVTIALYQLPNHMEAMRVRDELQAAHPDWVVDLNAIQTPQGPRLYALTQMGVSANAPTSSGLKKIRLGVIDGPFNGDAHLQTSSLVQHSVLPNEDQEASANHGNAVAALIAGAPLGNGFVGAAPNVNVVWAVATRQINGRDSTNSFLMSKALDWLIGQRVQIINISMGGAGDAVLATVFRTVGKKPVVVLAAAGNGGASASPAYPAAYPAVLAVTAVDVAEHIYSQANQGDYIAVAAAGVDVWTPTSGYVSGTSFASALAAGALARLGAPTSKASALNRLCRTAKDLGEAGNDAVFGCGLLQLK